MHKGRTKRFLLLFALYLALGLVYTMPVARYFASGVPYARYVKSPHQVVHNRHGDHLQLYYRFWLFKDALLGNSGFLENKYEFNTGDGDLIPISSYFMPYPLLFALFGLFGRAAGYNAVVISSCIFSGLSMYLLIRHYTGNVFASALGGIVFAIAPYRSASVLSGHPTGLSMFLLPLFIYSIEKVMSGKSWKHAVLGGIVFLLMTDNDLHVLYLTALVTPFFIIRHFVAAGLRNSLNECRRLIVPALPLIIICVLALAMKYARAPVVGSSMARNISEVKNFAPRTDDVFFRNHPLHSRYVYLGAAACAFAGVMLVVNVIRARRPIAEERETLKRMAFFLVMLLASYILTFGPRLPFSAPYRFLYAHLPKFSMIRQTVKLMIVSTFALSALAGLAFAYLRTIFSRRWAIALSAAALALIMIDYFPFPSKGAGISILPGGDNAYEQVFGNRPDVRVVNVPIWPGNSAWSSHYQYLATIYRTIMVNGYNPLPPKGYSDAVFHPLKSLNAGQLQQRQHELLRKMNVEYLVFHEESFPSKVCIFPSQYALENLNASPYLLKVAEEPPVSIFKVLDEKSEEKEDKEIIFSDENSSIVARVHEGEKLNKNVFGNPVGEVIKDEKASNGHALLLRKENDTATRIRRRTTPGGRFTFSARVKSDESSRFKISVFRSRDGSLIESKAFDLDTGGSYEIVSLEFSLEEATSILYILDRRAGSALTVDWTRLKFANQKMPPEEFEFEELFHTGNVRRHDKASGGRALFLTQVDPKGEATWGPYRLYERGQYEITLSIARGAERGPEKDDVIASVIISDNMKNVIMSEKKIKAGELKMTSSTGDFKDMTYRFELKRPTFLNVNVHHFGHDLYLDKVTVRKVEE